MALSKETPTKFFIGIKSYHQTEIQFNRAIGDYLRDINYYIERFFPEAFAEETRFYVGHLRNIITENKVINDHKFNAGYQRYPPYFPIKIRIDFNNQRGVIYWPSESVRTLVNGLPGSFTSTPSFAIPFDLPNIRENLEFHSDTLSFEIPIDYFHDLRSQCWIVIPKTTPSKQLWFYSYTDKFIREIVVCYE